MSVAKTVDCACVGACGNANSATNTLRINEMPAPTWHRLKVNATELAFDLRDFIVAGEDGEESDATDENTGVNLGLNNMSIADFGAFDEALKNCKTYSQPSGAGERAVCAAAKGEVDALDLNYPALSAYQKRAVLSEIDGSPAKYFETGAGSAAEQLVAGAHYGSNLDAISLVANAGEKSSATLYISPAYGFENCVSIDLIARKNSECEINVIYLDAEDGTASTEANGAGGAADAGALANTRADAASALFAGCTLRVFAGANARVNVNTIQALTNNATVIDNSGYSLCAGAKVSVEQHVLGGSKTYTGLAADLHGDASQIEVRTKYIGQGAQSHDFNYIVKQRGRNTQSNIDANGILAGVSKKVLRGTIDFVHGCKGSVGSERESVLLASEGARADTNLNNAAGTHEAWAVQNASETYGGAITSSGSDASAQNKGAKGAAETNGSVIAGGDPSTSAQETSKAQPTCKTVPVILCDEDDVSGNHGATIGHVKPETRFYLHARGLSDEQIEHLFLSSFIEDARTTAPTDLIKNAQIDAFASHL